MFQKIRRNLLSAPRYPLYAIRSTLSQRGFTLVEILIYVVIFVVSSVFLVNILVSMTRTQTKQASVNDINQQISFVANTFQRLVRESSLIENPAGVASTTLVLRMSSSTLDSTKIFVDASSTAIYLQEGAGAPEALTSDKVRVANFSVTKYENAGGFSVAQVDLTLEANTDNIQAKSSRTWRSAIARVSAATFDSSILPNADSSLDIGNAGTKWKDGYFSGDVTISGRLGLGGSPSASSRLKSTGDIGFSTSTAGIVLMSSGGNCYRVTVTNAGLLATSSVACP